MKKKILCLFLCLMILPTIFVFSACGKADAYNLDNLALDYLSIADGKSSLKITESENNGNRIYKFEYDYSNFKYNEREYFNEVLTLDKYKTITYYNNILYNTLEFSANNIARCANNEIEVDNNFKNELYKKLDNLAVEFNSMEESIKNFARLLESVQEKADWKADLQDESSIYLPRLESFLEEYNDLIMAAYDFNLAVSRVYFNHLLTNANVNYSIGEFDESAARTVLNLLDSRIKLQKANLGYYYMTTSIIANGLSDSTYSSYNADIAKISVNGNLADKLAGADLPQVKQAAIKLFNIQQCFNNEYEGFVLANKTIDYSQTKNNVNATYYEMLCVQIIENYNFLIDAYTDAINGMLVLLGAI